MLRFVLASLLFIGSSAALTAECHCSPAKLEALKAKLREQGKSEDAAENMCCEEETEKKVSFENEPTRAEHLAACNCRKKNSTSQN